MKITFDTDEKIRIAKALRASFCAIQRDMLKTSYMSDEYLIGKVRQMQADYQIFSRLTDEIEKSDPDLYEKEIIGSVRINHHLNEKSD
jgi:hypothetical protein